MTKDALIDTNQRYVYSLIESCKLALIEEISASNTYSTLLQKISNALSENDTFPTDIKQDILRRVTEIKKDEETHMGSILFIIEKLDPIISQNMLAGVHGK